GRGAARGEGRRRRPGARRALSVLVSARDAPADRREIRGAPGGSMIPAVALGALLLGGPAEPAANREAGLSAVSLAVDDCPAVPREELARLLALELGAPVLAPEQAGERALH